MFSGMFSGFGSKAKKSNNMAVPSSVNAPWANSSSAMKAPKRSKMSDNMASACYQAAKFSNKSAAHVPKKVAMPPQN